MENNAVINERRFRHRYDAAALKVEVCPVGWFGITGKKKKAFALDFSLGGISVVSESKFKAGQMVLITLECDMHCLQDIPMQVIRCNEKDKEYVLALQFNLGNLPDAARTAAYAVLKSIESELKQNVAA